jgi:DNA-binding GntR family transcriptional regulator
VPASSAERDGPAGESEGATAGARNPREQVVGDVIRGLYEGRYQPGQRLKEAHLAKALGISRGPIREALNRLDALGIVSLTPQRGAQIRRLSREEAIGILLVVEALVGIAAGCAAERISSPGAAVRLQAALERLVNFDPSSAEPEHALARDSFYSTLTDIAGNAEIRRILPTVQIHLIRTQFAAEMERTNRSRHADYRQIVDAVLAGRWSIAEKAARMHIARAIEALREARRSDEGPPPSRPRPRSR